jgi:hypothetical protein
MMRAILGALLLATLAGCTYVNEAPPSRGAGYDTAPVAGYAPPGSYERERQAYESGRRDGALGR